LGEPKFVRDGIVLRPNREIALAERPPSSADPAFARDRELAHCGFSFALGMASQGFAGLKPLDALIVMAVNQANIGPLTRDPLARSRYGALEAPAPDEERRPVSVRAVAASMRLAYETARRRVRQLESTGVCVVSEAGLVVPESFLASAAFVEVALRGHQRMHALYETLQDRGLLEPLPASNYPAETRPPVRGAVRLMSDYLLRTADALVAVAGDLISSLVLLPLVADLAGGDPQADLEPTTVAALARRLQLPAETVRRHVAELGAAGHCRVDREGVRLADPSLGSPEMRTLLRENAIALQRLFAGLSERGVVDVWRGMAAGGPEDLASGAA
jgi:DNA-binding Lrp family transcriptional regulator